MSERDPQDEAPRRQSALTALKLATERALAQYRTSPEADSPQTEATYHLTAASDGKNGVLFRIMVLSPEKYNLQADFIGPNFEQFIVRISAEDRLERLTAGDIQLIAFVLVASHPVKHTEYQKLLRSQLR